MELRVVCTAVIGHIYFQLVKALAKLAVNDSVIVVRIEGHALGAVEVGNIYGNIYASWAL